MCYNYVTTLYAICINSSSALQSHIVGFFYSTELRPFGPSRRVFGNEQYFFLHPKSTIPCSKFQYDITFSHLTKYIGRYKIAIGPQSSDGLYNYQNFSSSVPFIATTTASMTMLLWKQMLYRNRCTLLESTSGIRSLVTSLSLEAIEKAAARHAANHFISSMDKNSNYIDTPTICVSDPSSLTSWEWSASLDIKTKLTAEEILHMSKSCSVDAFQLVEKDISTLSGMLALLLFARTIVNKRYPLPNGKPRPCPPPPITLYIRWYKRATW